MTQVLYLKENSDKRFAIVDGAMNDLIRPALYSAWQNIIPVNPRDEDTQVFDIVGPVCETGDFLGKDRQLAIAAGIYWLCAPVVLTVLPWRRTIILVRVRPRSWWMAIRLIWCESEKN